MPATLNPVPALPKCRMVRIASFKAGHWNGQTYSVGFVRQLVENFKRFSTGPTPYYRPYLSIQHNDNLRFGKITGATLERDGTLFLDADDVPTEVGRMVNSGMLTEPSIEFLEPTRDKAGRPVSGFTDQNGRVVDGPVLKCLTFVGNDLPGVKGLPSLPPAVFRHTGGIVRSFSGRFGMRQQMNTADRAEFARIMAGLDPAAQAIVQRFVDSGSGSGGGDRQSMLQFLRSAGVNVDTFTESVPDAALSAIVTYLKTLQAGTNPAEQQQPSGQFSHLSGAGRGIDVPDDKGFTRRERLLSGSPTGRAVLINGGTTRLP